MIDCLAFLMDVRNISKLDETGVTGVILADPSFSSGLTHMKKIDAETSALVHAHGKMLFVKLDRLYSEDEIQEVFDYIEYLQQAGVDGIVYTDIGVLQMLKKLNSPLKALYAPETLLTNSHDIGHLKGNGAYGCVISKDIPLRDVYAIIRDVPDYCYLRIHGPIIMAYSRRRYIASYLGDKKEYAEGYFLQEETRREKLPYIEKENGSWLYAGTLHSFGELSHLQETALKGIIIDNVIWPDDCTVLAVQLYDRVTNGELTGEQALRQLKKAYPEIEYTDINELRETWLEKEKDNG